MPSYITTPLFPIQEAVNSEMSLPQSKSKRQQVQIYSDSEASSSNEINMLMDSYRKSEYEYNIELQVLKSIAKNFNPIYNNYYDSSLDDITNEMVKERQNENGKFMKIVQNLIIKHKQLYEALNTSKDKLETLLINISQWGLDIDRLYSSYLQYYKLDMNQPKTEIKIRRRPLIRIRYLNMFFKSLKNIVIQMTAKPYIAELISNFEVITFKLTKLLEEARIVDEKQRSKCENFVHTYTAKDVIQLRSVCVSLDQDSFKSNIYNCNLHYINSSQNATLNFLKINVIFIEALSSIAIVRNESSGKSLLFAPIKKHEFRFLKSNDDSNGRSLLFNHSLLKKDVQLCFTFDSKLQPDFESKLMDIFPLPVNLPTETYKPITAGLGIKVIDTSSTTTSSYEELGEFTNIPTVPINVTRERKSRPLTENTNLLNKHNNTANKTLSIPPRKLINTNLAYPSKIKSSDASRQLYIPKQSNPSLTTENRHIELSKKILQQVVDDELSEEEVEDDAVTVTLGNTDNDDDNDDVSMISKTEELHFVSDKLINIPQKENNEVKIAKVESFKEVDINEPTQVERKEVNSTEVPTQGLGILANTAQSEHPRSHIQSKRSIDVSKYQNSIPFKEQKKSKPQLIFGSLSNLLSKKNVRRSSFIPQLIKSNSIPPTTNDKEVLSSKSEQSIASIVNENGNNELLMSIISTEKCFTKSLPDAKISVWNGSSWGNSKATKLMLYEINNSEYYLGFFDSLTYSENANSNDMPLLLCKLTSKTDCMFNAVDIHVKTTNYRDIPITILIRPFDAFGMKIIGNAVVSPESIDMLITNSNSYDSQLSKNSEQTQDTSISNNTQTTSASSIHSVTADEHATKHEIIQEFGKSWSGMGSIKLLMKNGILKDLNRCVFNVSKANDGLISVDFIGFEFGTIDLSVSKEQFKEVGDLQLMIESDESYILTFDSNECITMFYECVY